MKKLHDRAEEVGGIDLKFDQNIAVQTPRRNQPPKIVVEEVSDKKGNSEKASGA